jgi:hypothetical protein
MHVVAHQDVGVDLAAASNRSLCQAFQVQAPIQVAEKAGQSVVAPLHDMQRDTGYLYAAGSGHRAMGSNVVTTRLTLKVAKS